MRIRFLLGLAGLILFAHEVHAQVRTSPHEHHLGLFRNRAHSEADYDSANGLDPTYARPISQNCQLRKQVYGWHPAWSGTAYMDYDYPLLSTIGYFAYEVDAATGGYTTTNNWDATTIVDSAHAGGCQVELTASLFGSSSTSTLLKNAGATETLRDSLVALVLRKDADGVCIDFEGMGSSLKTPFVNFITLLADTLHGMAPRRTLTICLYAVDWNKVFDLPALAGLADRFVVMAYDYHWSTAPTTGPVAPLRNSTEWGNYSAESSLQYYLKGGIPAEKLLLGMPYYGYKWPTQDSTAGTKTTGSGKSVLLRNVGAKTAGMNGLWNAPGYGPWWLPTVDTAQVWCEDSTSIVGKLRMADSLGIAGVGIWALGYDHGLDTYWDILKREYATCSPVVEDPAQQEDIYADGETSADRNRFNWVWMVVGGIAAVGIILLVGKLLR